MPNVLTPTTHAGLKSVAKTVKRRQGVTSSEAHDIVARRMGFDSYRHYLNQKPDPAKASGAVFAPPATDVVVRISANWRNPDRGDRGRETYDVQLSHPLDDLIAPAQLANGRYIGGFRKVDGNRLENIYHYARTQQSAQDQVMLAARTLLFMDATGLKPSISRSRIYPDGHSENAMPGLDHETAWFDPATRSHVLADEPYFGADARRVVEREAWAEKHGWVVVLPDWKGMYYPDGQTRLWLATDARNALDLSALAGRLNRLPSLEGWLGVSSGAKG